MSTLNFDAVVINNSLFLFSHGEKGLFFDVSNIACKRSLSTTYRPFIVHVEGGENEKNIECCNFIRLL